MKKTIAVILTVVVLTVLLASCASTTKVGSFSGMRNSQGKGYWNGSWKSVKGMIQNKITLDKGTYIFSFDVKTDSGEIDITVKDKDGSTVYYSGKDVETSKFTVEIDLSEKKAVYVRMDGEKHKGSVNIKWAEK